jgi:hypothetical protein
MVNLDNRENYMKEQRLLMRQSTIKLKQTVADLYKIRYGETQNESVDGYYRLAVSVLLERSQNVFKKFEYGCWIVLILLVSSIYKVFNI